VCIAEICDCETNVPVHPHIAGQQARMFDRIQQILSDHRRLLVHPCIVRHKPWISRNCLRAYCSICGRRTRSRNKPYLQKRLAWRVQELSEGGLSQSTLAKIKELGDKIPENWRKRLDKPAPVAERDSRLPAVGATPTRTYQGHVHRVGVREDGFSYGKKEFKSLSAIARLITGTSWNGFLFFALETRGSGAKK
jgi:Protein of unknown function (DUF2924)